MSVMASQITSLTIVYSTVDSGADQRKHQSSASLDFVWGIHRSPVNSSHKGPVTRKMFAFDDVLMTVVSMDLTTHILAIHTTRNKAYLIPPYAIRLQYLHTWWRHQMESSCALLALCAGNSSVTGEIPPQGQWRGALMFSLICAWINDWVSNGEAGDLRRHRARYDVIVMIWKTAMISYLCCNHQIRIWMERNWNFRRIVVDYL